MSSVSSQRLSSTCLAVVYPPPSSPSLPQSTEHLPVYSRCVMTHNHQISAAKRRLKNWFWNCILVITGIQGTCQNLFFFWYIYFFFGRVEIVNQLVIIWYMNNMFLRDEERCAGISDEQPCQTKGNLSNPTLNSQSNFLSNFRQFFWGNWLFHIAHV